MDESSDYRDAFRSGLRRAGLHWVRATYEVVAGVGAFLDELARARRAGDGDDAEDTAGDPGPVKIELD